MSPTSSSESMIDWGLARRAARRMTPAGPQISEAEARSVVDDLRACAAAARQPVAETTGLVAPDGGPPAVVVDRGRWIDANAESFQAMMDPVSRRLLQIQRERTGTTPPRAVRAVSGTITGTEVAGLLAYLSSKILGQYDIAPGRPIEASSLMLVAPNIVAVARELKVDEHDFRLWVCLHEETHRVQFSAVPWLRDHLLARTDHLAVDLVPDPEQFFERLRSLPSGLKGAVSPGSTGLAELFTTPEQREEIGRITAVMALLEGHADVVMDEVGPAVVPSVADIRAKFEKRRDGFGFVNVVIRRLLGMEAKMAQYRDGAGFVRGVTQQVGRDGFNAVWAQPDNLPSPAEIADPAAWVSRVRG